MSEDVRPALTESEWKHERWESLDCDTLVVHDDGDGLEFVIYGSALDRDTRNGANIVDKLKVAGSERKAIAALALLRHPDGFTREDVELLESYAKEAEYLYRCGMGKPNGPALRSIAARIAALLPPEKG